MAKFRLESSKTMLAGVGAAIIAYGCLSGLVGEPAAPRVEAQTDMYLSRRIDQIEQRFYGIESRIARVEQEARRPGTAPPAAGSGTDAEIRSLRTQVDSMRLRLGEAECGLLRVDERTLTVAARSARRRSSTGGTENCRLNHAAAVELSARP